MCHGPVHFSIFDFHIVLGTDLSKNKPKAHSALGNCLILSAKLFFRLVSVFDLLAFVLKFMLKLMPDLIEFLSHQRWRQFEIMQLVKLVEHVAFQLGQRDIVIIRLDLARHCFTQLFKVLHAELLGKSVIDGDLCRTFDCFDGGLKDCFFAGKIRRAIVLGE